MRWFRILHDSGELLAQHTAATRQRFSPMTVTKIWERCSTPAHGRNGGNSRSGCGKKPDDERHAVQQWLDEHPAP